VAESNQRGYSVGSRGSVGSSLAAYLLGITEVNPLPAHERCLACGFSEFRPGERLSGVDLSERPCPRCGGRLRRDGHDIPFETFVGFKGNKVPDIDLNFAPEVQGEIQKYAETLFGEGRAFKAGTISTLSDKTAFGYVRKYFEAKGQAKRRVEVERIKAQLEGVKRTSGSHPGGVILVRHDKDIIDFTPVQYSGDSKELGGREAKEARDLVTTHFDYHALDENLVKLDILGKDDASAFRHLQELTGVAEPEVALDDPQALSLFSSRQALGLPALNKEEEELFGASGAVAIPEFGTENTRRMLELTKPKNFTELIYISGLSHGTNVWTRNAEELIRGGTASLETVISTRDDIMNRLVRQGMDPAMAFEITEKVRKGAAAREGFSPAQEKALAEAKLPRWWVESCKKITYMFPKAHATAYCFTAVRMAWFKVHHPRAFYAAWLTLNAESFEAPAVAKGRQEVLTRIRALKAARMAGTATAKDEGVLNCLTVTYESLLRGVRFLPVDLYQSHPFRFMPGKAAEELLPPLVSVGGLGSTAASHVVAERQAAPFKSAEDLASRAGLNKTVMERLAASGTLDVLPKTNQITLF
jgi:DNA polymerase-3 subunit alpha (Gram-positive type)